MDSEAANRATKSRQLCHAGRELCHGSVEAETRAMEAEMRSQQASACPNTTAQAFLIDSSDHLTSILRSGWIDMGIGLSDLESLIFEGNCLCVLVPVTVPESFFEALQLEQEPVTVAPNSAQVSHRISNQSPCFRSLPA